MKWAFASGPSLTNYKSSLDDPFMSLPWQEQAKSTELGWKIKVLPELSLQIHPDQ